MNFRGKPRTLSRSDDVLIRGSVGSTDGLSSTFSWNVHGRRGPIQDERNTEGRYVSSLTSPYSNRFPSPVVGVKGLFVRLRVRLTDLDGG